MSVLILLTALVALSLAQTASNKKIQCDFELRRPSMPNGFVLGTMKYSYDDQRILHLFTTSGTREMFAFNSNNGNSNFDEQFHYTWSSTCPCSISPLAASQPVLFPDSSRLRDSGNGVFVPTSTASLLKSVTFSGGFPATATFTDGQSFKYSNCKAYSPSATDFAPPTDCTCGKPIDIVLVLDRSSSISKEEFTLEKKFTQNLVASFSYSPLAVNLGITNFHTLTWDGPVTLAQGNSDASVSAGASALQCNPDAQCKVFGNTYGSCCGSGTSVSAGVVNGADMLAKAADNGIRKDAAKVLIVLTDGYHNKVLKKDSSGNLVRDSSGKPQGTPFVIGGVTCNEDKTQAACKNGLLDDLKWSVDYAVKKVPSVSIFSIGVGTVWSKEQLLAIANGKESNVFGTDSWDRLSTLVDDLVLVTCQQSPENPNCASCCGFCACNGCVAPDGCDPGNFCDTITKVGTCCNAAPKPASDCQEADKCYTYTCDRTLNGGNGGCKSTLRPIKANTTCAAYKCDPVTGDTIYTDLCPPVCLVNTDCDDKNECTINTCVQPDPDPHKNYCKTDSRNCQGDDKCSIYTCDPVEGCLSEKKPLPDNTTCAGFTCNATTGLAQYTNLCPVFPKCYNDSQCDDKNACTIDVCVSPGVVNVSDCQYSETNCDKGDKCKVYSCDPKGGCLETDAPSPANTTCAQYTCDPATGEITFTDLCPPQPPCLIDADCDDMNACTADACVLDATDPLKNRCEWTDTSAECDDGDACTVDKCEPESGCTREPLEWEALCEDNDACTIESCDPASTNLTHPCAYEPVICNETDICHNSYCDVQRGCILVDILCPITDNCTVSGCNVTDDEGCYVESAGVCGFPVGAVAGIAAGVVAGIVVAAVAGALIVGGGTAYAFTQGAGAGLGATVSNNPIFTPAGESGYSRLHKVGA